MDERTTIRKFTSNVPKSAPKDELKLKLNWAGRVTI
jgi:hypothetical protein